jgi:DNA-binding response OmpR family regulator
MKKKICVLEDSEDIRELIGIVFTEEKFDVISFSTVNEFYSGYRKVEADVFLLDVMLPDGNGLDVCNSIKNDLATKEKPVVIMTANSGIHNMNQLCNAEDFISKPFDIDDLVKRVSYHASR